jgi:hypothetical protein
MRNMTASPAVRCGSVCATARRHHGSFDALKVLMAALS